MGDASAVAYGVSTAIGAGSADYLAKTTTDRVGALSSLWYLEIFGVPILVVLAILFDGFPRPPLLAVVGLAALSSLNVLGLFFLYLAFEHGRLSIVAPLTSGYPALTVVLSVVILGERFTPYEVAGLGITLLGIVILSSQSGSSRSGGGHSGVGVAAALAAFVAFGCFYFGLKFFIGPVPPVTGAAITRIVGLALVGPVMLSRHRRWWPPRGIRARALAFPVMDSSSLVVFNLGVLSSGSIAILTTTSGLYGAVTLAWAIVFLRERPGRAQWGGCLMIFVGIVLLALL